MGDKVIDVIEIVMALIVAAIGTAILCQAVGRYFINYTMNSDGIIIMLLGALPIKHILFRDIIDIQRLSLREAYIETAPWKGVDMYFAQAWGNRVWGDVVLLRKRAKLFSVVLISPDNAEEFVQEVRRRMATVLRKNSVGG